MLSVMFQAALSVGVPSPSALVRLPSTTGLRVGSVSE